ncbi:E3 SUMO-protein ligase NSE2 [Microplitis demolitor]|uniref:E3 SUMO-protein ligase NSE2 n=1 Tax=Microplitis demolitor TaxID=69319 RepID=UPI0004CD4741|nr:E3 SUMO-protein ligase NSE2 [Microplitis demolitor]
MSEFEKSLSAICDSVTKTAAYAISYADSGTQEQILNTLRGSVENYLECGDKMKHMNELINQLASNNADTDIEQTIQQFNDGVFSYAPNVAANKYLREYDHRVNELKKNLAGARGDEEDDDNDGELQITEDDHSNRICPISKVRMTEPMKNDICGHVYDKASIIALLQRNPATRCPIVGCSNKEYLNMNHLKSDIVRQMCLDNDLE